MQFNTTLMAYFKQIFNFWTMIDYCSLLWYRVTIACMEELLHNIRFTEVGLVGWWQAQQQQQPPQLPPSTRIWITLEKLGVPPLGRGTPVCSTHSSTITATTTSSSILPSTPLGDTHITMLLLLLSLLHPLLLCNQVIKHLACFKLVYGSTFYN